MLKLANRVAAYSTPESKIVSDCIEALRYGAPPQGGMAWVSTGSPCSPAARRRIATSDACKRERCSIVPTRNYSAVYAHGMLQAFDEERRLHIYRPESEPARLGLGQGGVAAVMRALEPAREDVKPSRRRFACGDGWLAQRVAVLQFESKEVPVENSSPVLLACRRVQ